MRKLIRQRRTEDVLNPTLLPVRRIFNENLIQKGIKVGAKKEIENERESEREREREVSVGLKDKSSTRDLSKIKIPKVKKLGGKEEKQESFSRKGFVKFPLALAEDLLCLDSSVSSFRTATFISIEVFLSGKESFPLVLRRIQQFTCLDRSRISIIISKIPEDFLLKIPKKNKYGLSLASEFSLRKSYSANNYFMLPRFLLRLICQQESIVRAKLFLYLSSKTFLGYLLDLKEDQGRKGPEDGPSLFPLVILSKLASQWSLGVRALKNELNLLASQNIISFVCINPTKGEYSISFSENYIQKLQKERAATLEELAPLEKYAVMEKVSGIEKVAGATLEKDAPATLEKAATATLEKPAGPFIDSSFRSSLDFSLESSKEASKESSDLKIDQYFKKMNMTRTQREREFESFKELVQSGYEVKEILLLAEHLSTEGDLKGHPCGLPLSYLSHGAYKQVKSIVDSKSQGPRVIRQAEINSVVSQARSDKFQEYFDELNLCERMFLRDRKKVLELCGCSSFALANELRHFASRNNIELL